VESSLRKFPALVETTPSTYQTNIMNRFTPRVFVGLQVAMSSLTISQMTNHTQTISFVTSMNDTGLNFDRGSGRIECGY
jgi:hypothetical protein